MFRFGHKTTANYMRLMPFPACPWSTTSTLFLYGLAHRVDSLSQASWTSETVPVFLAVTENLDELEWTLKIGGKHRRLSVLDFLDNWFCNLQLAGKDWQIRTANPLVTSYKYNENYRSLKSRTSAKNMA